MSSPIYNWWVGCAPSYCSLAPLHKHGCGGQLCSFQSVQMLCLFTQTVDKRWMHPLWWTCFKALIFTFFMDTFRQEGGGSYQLTLVSLVRPQVHRPRDWRLPGRKMCIPWAVGQWFLAVARLITCYTKNLPVIVLVTAAVVCMEDAYLSASTR